MATAEHQVQAPVTDHAATSTGLPNMKLAIWLFLASEVSPADFDHVYTNLNPRDHFPGLLALVYAHRESRTDGDHFVSTLIAPHRGNERLFGLDIVRQPANLAAVFRSRDSDQPALSAPFALVQMAGRDVAADGVILRLPIFTQGPRPATVTERRERLRGSLGVSFQIHRVIETALPADVLERAKRAWDPAGVAKRAVRIVRERRLDAVDGSPLTVDVPTICVHGDASNALEVARAVRERLQAEGIDVVPLARMLHDEEE